jgi:hypothetical protein
MKERVLYLIMIIYLNSCLDYGPDIRNIKVSNKTEKDVYCLSASSDSFTNPYIDYYKKGMDEFFLIKQDSAINIPDKPKKWDSFFSKCKDGKMRIFIIDKDSVNKHGWEDVLTKGIYNRVYKIDMDYLEKNNWEIIYNLD